MKPRGLFIAGTDTCVGKTIVTAGVLAWLRNQGVDAAPMKPVQTGSRRIEKTKNGWHSPDLEVVLRAAGLKPSVKELSWMCPYHFEPACSPHLAAKMAKRKIEIKKIVYYARWLLSRHEFVVAEGSGGLQVPLNRSKTMLDLIAKLRFPVLLVARSGLGTINHTLLSLRALRERKIDVLGVALNDVEPVKKKDFFIRKDNAATIAQWGRVRVLGTLRHLPQPIHKIKNLPEIFEKDLPGLSKISKP